MSHRVICEAPILRPLVVLIEIGAAHRNVIWSGGKSAHSKALCGSFLSVEIVAACRAAVAGRDRHGNALGRGLLPKGLEKLIPSGSKMLFARAETHTDDVGKVVIYGVDSGQMDARGGFCRCGGDEVNFCSGGHSTGPLNIQIGFDFASVQSRVDAVENDVLAGKILRQAKNCAEVDDILNLYVGFTEDSNGLACSRNSGGPKRCHLVDFCEISRCKREKLAAVSGGRVQWSYCS